MPPAVATNTPGRPPAAFFLVALVEADPGLADVVADLHAINREHAQVRLAALLEADPALLVGVAPSARVRCAERVVESAARWTGGRDVSLDALDAYIRAEVAAVVTAAIDAAEARAARDREIREARRIEVLAAEAAAEAEAEAAATAKPAPDVQAIRRDLLETGARLLADARRRLATWSCIHLPLGIEPAAPAQLIDVADSATSGIGRPEQISIEPVSEPRAAPARRLHEPVRSAPRACLSRPRRPRITRRARPAAIAPHGQARAPP